MFQTFNGRPAGTKMNIVRSVNKQTNLSTVLLQLFGGYWLSGNAGEPLPVWRIGRDILNLVSLLLQLDEQIFKAGGCGNKQVAGSAYFMIL